MTWSHWTVVWRAFTDAKGVNKIHRAVVYEFESLFRRVRHGDGEKEELSRRKIEKGKENPRNTDAKELESEPLEGSRRKGQGLEQVK